jgi:hypothetical protein
MDTIDSTGVNEPAVRPSTQPYHAVRFYENERSLAGIVAEFLADGLNQGHPAIVVASASQRAAILRELMSIGLDVVQLQRAGDVVLLDAQDTLDTFMVDGEPDAARFKEKMCDTLQQACRGRSDCTLRIYGQMVDVLWKEGKQEAALRLEMLWNQLAASEAFSLLCGYAMGHFYKDVDFNEVCRQHTHVVAAGGEREEVVASTLPPSALQERANDRSSRLKPKRR